MTENDVSTIGRNVARYRKLAKLSADELATAAENGLTRSVIANLENGRKDDVSVKQLLALCKALGVPPVSLMVDVHNPGELPEFTIERGMVADFDFKRGERTTAPGRFRNIEAALWIGGRMQPRTSDMSPAQESAYGTLNIIGGYRSAYSSWWGAARAYKEALVEEAQDSAGFLDRNPPGEIEYLREKVLERADQVTHWVRILDLNGIRVENTPSFVDGTMRDLGITYSSEDAGPRGTDLSDFDG